MRQQQDEPGRFSICSRQAAVVHPELHRRVAEMAMEEDLSLNAFVNKALEKEVSNHRAGA
ncbi:toxin-antitoxin system HicB family antitoxin [Escherichia coli]|uniref:toxin-antitoxin system HicB family antitoxin n=1 Tax=Escherichia coli TaxID=562 RepID=UPI0010F7ADDC|nr:toxin-antitoxin system HicB family antitoxin [Escherichia coli]EFD5362779.1 toxin-antitoxin system HicB family antitoxin [Escherichia coli]